MVWVVVEPDGPSRAERVATEGEAGLADRSSRPHTSPTGTPVEAEDRIIALRACERRGPDWLGPELGVPARTVSRSSSAVKAPVVSPGPDDGGRHPVLEGDRDPL